MPEILSIRPTETPRALTMGDAPLLQRVKGEARLAAVVAGGGTVLTTFYQSGAAKLRLPRRVADGPLEAVLLNTAGGVTGGDHLRYVVTAGPRARVVVTSQAAERVYKRTVGEARIENVIIVGAGATLDWLPQETILFDRSALSRSLTVELAPTARLLAVEAVVLGRKAMGETTRDIDLADRWRIRRGDTLLYADTLRLAGDAVATMAGAATGNGAGALGTVVLAAPDAEARLEDARSVLADATGEAGVSAWNGMLVARFIAPTGQALRADLIRLIERLRGAPMPRVWSC